MDINNSFTKRYLEYESQYWNFINEEIAQRALESAFKSISNGLLRKMKKADKASVTVPWGIFSAARRIKNDGDSAFTDVSYAPTPAFLEALNSDGRDRDKFYMELDEFDKEYIQDFIDYMAYGFFDADSEEGKAKQASATRVYLPPDIQVPLFVNAIAALMLIIAEDKERDGKRFTLSFDDAEVEGVNYGHGKYYFDFDDGKVSVKFVAAPAFKQALKDDDATGGDVI